MQDIASQKQSEFRQSLIGSWDKYCADAIITGTHIALTPTLRAFIEAWDFSAIRSLSVYDLLDDPAGKPAMCASLPLRPQHRLHLPGGAHRELRLGVKKSSDCSKCGVLAGAPDQGDAERNAVGQDCRGD